MKGRKHTEETRRKMRENHADFTGRKYSEETKRKMRKPKHEGHAEAVSEGLRRMWANMPEKEKSKRIKKSLICCSPNNQEAVLGQLLERLYPKEWKFVGNGQVVIMGKCPDFININGQKKIIELFGNYWHRGQNPKDREEIFKPFGYSTLVIWEKELRNKEELSHKLQEFHKQ